QQQPVAQSKQQKSAFMGGSQQRSYEIIYVAPPQYVEMAARALALIDSSTLIADPGLVIVQIHPKERSGVAAVQCERLVLRDERRYGSTLLMFYRTRENSTEEAEDSGSER